MGWEALIVDFFVNLLVALLERAKTDPVFSAKLDTGIDQLKSAESVEEAQRAAKELQNLIRSR